MFIKLLFINANRFTIERIYENRWNHHEHWTEIIDFGVIALIIIIIAVPEGIPLSF